MPGQMENQELSDQEKERAKTWLISVVRNRESISASELIQLAGGAEPSFSRNLVTWMLWYLVAERRLQINSDHQVSAA